MAWTMTHWLTTKRKLSLFVLMLLMLGAFGLLIRHCSNSLERTYINLCVEGSAEDLKRALDIYGWDVNKSFVVEDDEDYHPELFEYFLRRSSMTPLTFTPAFLASGNKDPDVLKLLIERGARVSQKELERALANWRTTNVLTLLEEISNQKIDLDFGDYSDPAVTYFVKYPVANEHRKIFKKLIDLHAFCRNSRAMFWNASKRVTDPTFYLMLEENGIAFQSNVTELLANAAESGRLETTRLFLERGADPNTVVRIYHTTNGPNPNYIYLPILVRAAMWNGGSEVLIALLEAGADPNARDSEGMTALMQLDKRIMEAHNNLEKLNSDNPKITYYNIRHELVKPGSEEWREFILNSQKSELKHIERLNESRAALMAFGARPETP